MRTLLGTGFLSLLLQAAACGEAAPHYSAEAELVAAHVETWFAIEEEALAELGLPQLMGPEAEVYDAGKAEICSRHGLTEADLLSLNDRVERAFALLVQDDPGIVPADWLAEIEVVRPFAERWKALGDAKWASIGWEIQPPER